MNGQLSLAVSLREDATFDNFLTVDSTRAQAVEFLAAGSDGEINLVYLWGAPGAGVSHLAQAVCHQFEDRGLGSQYLPLPELRAMDADTLLEGLEYQPLVCLEDIQCIGGAAEWERSLFNLYNRMAHAGHLLVVTADSAPTGLPLQLPDLISRLSAGLVFHLPAYNDEQKGEILRFRSARLGLGMSEEVAGFLLARYARDLADLMSLLRRLDIASLESKRRLTIPFIKQVLGW